MELLVTETMDLANLLQIHTLILHNIFLKGLWFGQGPICLCLIVLVILVSQIVEIDYMASYEIRNRMLK